MFKKILKWVGIVFAVLFIIGLIAGKNDKNTANSNNTEEVKNTKFVLNDKESAILNFLIQDDLRIFAGGGDAALINTGLVAVNASDVAKSYEENQVGADQAYYKKSLLLTGKVVSINSGLGNEPYIALKGSNQFLNPQIHFDGANINKISGIKKGDIYTFVCIGNGSIVGTPMFKDCEFADDYANNQVPEIKKDINNFLDGSELKNKNIADMLIASIELARTLPENSKCYTDSASCKQELLKAVKSFKKENLVNVKNELKQRV